MNKKYIVGIIAGLIVLVGVAAVVFDVRVVPGKDVEETPVVAPRPRNATYTIEGETVPLKNGESLVQVDAGVFVKYRYLMQADGSLNEDDVDDSGVIITGDAGGSGTFYYIAALESTPTGWIGTDAILLGDRIKLGTIDVTKNRIIVNYETRKPGEPFTTEPSVDVTRYFQAREGVLVEVGVGIQQ